MILLLLHVKTKLVAHTRAHTPGVMLLIALASDNMA